MTSQSIFPESPEQWLTHETPDDPVYFFYPDRLAATAARFQAGFPGLVTYAVKANPETEVMEVLVASGLTAFDVASVQEMRAARWVSPKSKLNYHNPVRSVSEIEAAHAFGIASWSIDRPSELEKIGDVSGQEISVRLKLPVSGGIYDFGEKFGAPPGLVSHLLKEVVARGGTPSITFHPGTQCHDPDAWARYIAAAAKAAKGAGVRLGRLNVGGGFPAQRGAHPVQLEVIFDTIAKAVKDSFGVDAPDLVCEPGRAMVADAYDLLVRIKALSDGQIYLNDGIYGGLAEWRDIAASDRITLLTPQGTRRTGPTASYRVFGPTCDSIDQLNEPLELPATLSEGDYLLIEGCGAYSHALKTGFNGYGPTRVITMRPRSMGPTRVDDRAP